MALKPAREEVWCLWPDGVMAPKEELEEYLSAPCAWGDDFQLVNVTRFHDDGTPCSWRPIKK